MKSAYVHIPFCHHICHYCDFNKVIMQRQPVDEYLLLLAREIKLASAGSNGKMETIFVGGGTPTALDARQLDQLCRGIEEGLGSAEEYTFEANPGDLTEEKMRILLSYGVNRLSFGVQSFNDDLLRAIGRSHKSEDVYRSIAAAEKLGFTNISVDLMFGLPGQSLEDFSDTLDKALELSLPHYSSYSLIVEPKTVFYNLLRKGKLHLPGEDSEASMYGLLMEKMERHGIRQYEISNFAKPGFESRHNLVYWNNEEYFGFGAGAHGYAEGIRYSNSGPLKKYMEPLKEGRLPIFETHEVSEKEKLEEEMFLGLRKTAGVSIGHFKEKFGADPLEVFAVPINKMKEKGLLEIAGSDIRLTQAGKYLGNEVFQSFLL